MLIFMDLMSEQNLFTNTQNCIGMYMEVQRIHVDKEFQVWAMDLFLLIICILGIHRQ